MKLLSKFLFILLTVQASSIFAQDWSVSGDNYRFINGVGVLDNAKAVKGSATITSNTGTSEGDIIRFIGNVILRKDGMTLYASDMVINKVTDIAEIRSTGGVVKIVNKDGTTLESPFINYKLKDEIFYFFGGGVITSDGNIVESESGTHYEKEGRTYLKNKVQAFNKSYLATADSANYNKNAKIMTILGRTTIWHKDGILTAKKGTYHEPSKTFRLFENSYALSKEHQAWADSVVYDKQREQLFLGKNTCILDTANHSALLADNGFIDKKKEYAFATKNAVGITFQPKEDSLFLRADTLKVFNVRNKHLTTKDSLIRFVKALGSVRYYRKDLQGTADSLVYSTKDSIMYMYGIPIIWNEQNQITADSISVFTKNKKVDRAELVLNSFIAQKETEKYYNQIKGRSMTVFFNDKNKISKVDVKGNGQTVYFVKDSTEIEGVNLATSSNIGINLDEGKVSTMVFKVKPESNIFPLGKVEESQIKLKGFKWTPENRPVSRFDITRKIVRKDQSKEVEAISKPTFPYYLQIYGKKLDTTFKE